MNKTPMKITKNLSTPETAGKYHRVICMTGKNKGLCYYLSDSRVIMGRSNQADIQIFDNQASREHVELSKIGNDYVLTDLGSQNGVVVNDLDVKQHKLKNGDKIIIGTTVYKYSYLEVVQDNLPANIEEDEDEDEVEEKSTSKNTKAKSKTKTPAAGKKKNNIVYILIGAMALIFLLPSEDEGGKKNTTNTQQKDERVFIEQKKKESSKKNTLEKEIEQKVEAYIHRGRREAREGNYFRAMEEFSLALMLDPNSGDAAFHMNRAKQRLDEKIESMFLQATKYKDSLKMEQALNSYCSVVKLLKDYQDDERYKEALKNVKDLASRLEKDDSESQCF